MDPLSISASVAGLITLAELIVSRGYEFLKGVKNAKAEISQLLVEITALFGVLQSLRLVALRFEGEHFNATLQLDYVQSCQKLVDQIHVHLKAALPEDSDGRWRAAGKSLRWPLSDKDTKALIADVGRHKATLSLALNVDGLNALLAVLNQQHTLSKGQDKLQDTIEHLHEEIEGRRIRDEIAAAHKRRRKILEEWTSIDPESQHAAAVRLRHPGTGKWFLEGEDFETFVKGRIPALWLYGIPGAGKTVLSSSIVETLKAKLVQKPTEGLAYFYCDYKDAATQQAANIVNSMVKHAAIQNERSCEDLQLFIERHKQDGTLVSTPSISNMTDIMLKMLGHYDCFYIVVDALDECPDDHRHEVLNILKTISTKASSARVIYTSREITDIKEAFNNFKSVRIAANMSDLELYVASEIEMRTSSGRLKIKHSEVKERIINKLTHEADGMFRWVSCQLDYLCELPNDKARLLALEKLPPNLFETYERILERIVARSEDVQRIVERTLRWTLGAVEKLTIPQLIEAIAVEEEENYLDEYARVEEEEIFRCCTCLIRKTADAESVELAHFTVDEFLKALNPQKTPGLARFANLRGTADVILGRTCLTYLNYDNFAKAKIQDLFWLLKNSFWTYAATQWHEHTAQTWEDEATRRLMRRFFHYSISPQFVIWNRFMWLHSHNMLSYTETKDAEDIYREWKGTRFEYVDSVIPLHQAAFLASEELTQWLVLEGSDPNKTSIIGTPLECALSSRAAVDQDEKAVLHIVSILLKFQADIHLASEANDGNSLLALAIKTENPDLIRVILDAGATIDISCIEMIDSQMSRKRSSGKALPAFLECISYEDVPVSIKPILMNLGLNYRSTTEKALSMLEQSAITFSENADLLDLTLQDAALKGQLDIVARTIPFLINPISSRNGEDQRTALHFASMNGHHDIVCLLLEKGADANVQDNEGNTPAHLCVEANVDLKVLESLIAHGTRISIVNNDRMNLLHLAAQSSRPDILAFLLTKDPTSEYRNLRTDNGATLVLCALASESKSLEMIRLAGDAISPAVCLAGNNDGETGLHLATKMFDMESMKYFLDKGNLNERTSDGSTALHLAFSDGDTETAKLLLDRGADICIITNDGDTPLHLAAFRHSSDLDAMLSAKGVDTIINKKDKDGRTAIQIVINQQYFTSKTLEMMVKLLNIPTADVNATDGDDTTPLILLAIQIEKQTVSQNETYDAIKHLLSKDVDLNKRDKAGSTALHRLCDTEVTECIASTIELLLQDKGIDVLVRNKEGSLAVEIMLQNIELSDKQAEGLSNPRTRVLGALLRRIPDEGFNALHRGGTRPFVLALQYKAKALAEELAPRTSDVDLSYDEHTSALCPLDACCAYKCDFRIFEMMASRSKDLSKKNKAGSTLLHLACYYNKRDILKYLLARKVDIEIEDNTGSTPLNLSMTYGHPEMMEALLDAGADPSHLNRGVLNLWHAAATSPSPEILDKLFEKAKIVELEARTSYGHTPLMCAVVAGRKENVESLLAHGAKLSVKDDSANGVLHLASVAGNSRILKILIQTGPSLDINSSNSQGQSPLLLAAANGHHTSVTMILRAGGDPGVKDEEDQTLVHHVALGGQTGILIRLKSDNVAFDLEAKNSLGRTPLLCAAAIGHALMVGHLIGEGGSLHAVDTDGFGLLHLAAYFGKASVISTIFLSATALGPQTEIQKDQQCIIDINAAHSVDGNTPLGLAAGQGHLAAFEALLDNSADLGKTNHQGWNVLHIAAVKMKRAVLKAIFDHCELWSVKFDVNARDKKGRTALMLLEEQGAKKGQVKFIAKFLLGKGAKRLELKPEEVEKTNESGWWEGSGGFCNVDRV